jgi:hypothetical protein
MSFLIAVVALFAAFCAGAQTSTGTVQWGAGNRYPYGPYASPNAACATVLNGLRGPAEGWGPNAYLVYSNAVANPAGWNHTPIGGYPYSATYCNYTETIYDCGTSCPYVMQITNGLPYVFAVLPGATCPTAICPVSPKETFWERILRTRLLLKAIIIIVLVAAVLIGGLLTLRNSGRAGMPDDEVLKRAAKRARELKDDDKD